MSWTLREDEIRERVRTRALVPAQDAGDLLTEIHRLRAALARAGCCSICGERIGPTGTTCGAGCVANLLDTLEVPGRERLLAIAAEARADVAELGEMMIRGVEGRHLFCGPGFLDCHVCGKSRPNPRYHFVAPREAR